MKIFHSFILVSCCCFAQDNPYTNPLSEILPPPIEQSTDYNNYQTPRAKQSQEPEYSSNYKDYLYEKEHPSPLKSFEDDKVKFKNYDKPAVVTTSETTYHEVQKDTNCDDFVKIGGVILGLLVVFLTFISLKPRQVRRIKRF